MRYHQITPAERYTLVTLLRQVPKPSCAAIARLMQRHRSTIARELRRNGSRYDDSYRFHRAQEQANGRRSRSRRKSHFTTADWQLIVQLLRADLSPEQVSGLLRLEGRLLVSHETIYQYIWRDKRRGGQLYRRLRQRPKHRKRYGTHEKRGQLPGKRHISERPPSVERRHQLGHWEVDTVVGTGTKHCIVSLVERSTGFVLIGKLRDRTVASLNRRAIELIRNSPAPFTTITADNGTEFHGYRAIEAATNVSIYFATPYHSWERGTNENTNGLIRQYLPKGTSMKTLTQFRCNEIAHILNNRPRKRHGFLSPLEKLIQTLPDDYNLPVSVAVPT
jgi:IS30 family transposase